MSATMPESRSCLSSDATPKRELNSAENRPVQAERGVGPEVSKKLGFRNPQGFLPNLLSLLLCLIWVRLPAQLEVDVALGATYSDNVFQLSDYDLERFDQEHPSLDYLDTSDDLTLTARIGLAYPIRYRWWKFTPSITGSFSENVSNTDKYRRDALVRFRVDRYYWNCTLLYGYYPRVYVRSYVDSDGTGDLAPFSYERNSYRADLNLKPIKNATLQLQGRYEEYFYNEYWTENDGDLLQLGLGLRYSFPAFSLSGAYHFKDFANTRHDAEDGSYESNLYRGELSLKPTPLMESRPKGVKWNPALALSFEEKFFQSDDDWYGGRKDRIWATRASLNFDFTRQWNLLLDYSHTFRNVDSRVSEVPRAREYGENRISATVKYSF